MPNIPFAPSLAPSFAPHESHGSPAEEPTMPPTRSDGTPAKGGAHRSSDRTCPCSACRTGMSKHRIRGTGFRSSDRTFPCSACRTGMSMHLLPQRVRAVARRNSDRTFPCSACRTGMSKHPLRHQPQQLRRPRQLRQPHRSAGRRSRLQGLARRRFAEAAHPDPCYRGPAGSCRPRRSPCPCP